MPMSLVWVVVPGAVLVVPGAVLEVVPGAVLEVVVAVEHFLLLLLLYIL